MEPFVIRRRGRWTSAMVNWLITFTLLISQGQVQSSSVVRWSPHTAAVIGQSVTLACVFNSSATCTWTRTYHTERPIEVRSGNGYSFDGDYKKAFPKATTNCSLTIDAVKREDFAMWYCTGFSTPDKHSPWTYITEQVTPSAPVIRFDNVNVSEIELPSRHPLSHMVCRSESGNPAPSLHWEVNGTVYKGKLKTTPADTVYLYTVELHWDENHRWQMLDYVSEIICKAIHPGFQDTVVAKVELRRKYPPRTVKVLADGFNDNNISIERSANVTLSCISDGHPQPITYTWELWSEKDKQWTMYRPNEQNITVTTKQLGKYRCKASNQLNQRSPTTSINQIIVTESMPPSSPVIWFNDETVSAIDLPSADPASHMVCKSGKGNPPPQLHWEVNGIRYLGKVTTVDVGAYLYMNELIWDRGGGWHLFDNAREVVCRANYPGVTNATEARVAFNRNFTDGTMAMVTKESNGIGPSAIVAIVLGVTLIVTVIIFTTCVTRLRRKLRGRNEASPSSLPAMALSKARVTITSTGSGGAPSSGGEVVLYEDARSCLRQCSARRANVDSNEYLTPLPVYEEIKDQRPRVKGQEDRDYVALF